MCGEFLSTILFPVLFHFSAILYSFPDTLKPLEVLKKNKKSCGLKDKGGKKEGWVMQKGTGVGQESSRK